MTPSRINGNKPGEKRVVVRYISALLMPFNYLRHMEAILALQKIKFGPEKDLNFLRARYSIGKYCYLHNRPPES